MNNSNNEESAMRLHAWLQANSQDSPGFVSLHPADGKEEQNESGGVTWLPNKDGWARPEGYQEPLSFKTKNFCKTEKMYVHFIPF